MADGVTPILLFGLGVLMIVPCALAGVFLRRRRSRGPDPSLDQVAGRVARLIRRLVLIPIAAAVAFVGWAGLAGWAHILGDLRSEALVLLGLLWVLTAPLLGLRVLAASLRAAGGGPRGA